MEEYKTHRDAVLANKKQDPNYEQFSGVVPKDLSRRFRQVIAAKGLKLSDGLADAMREYVERHEPEIMTSQAAAQPQTFTELIRNSYFALINSGKINQERLKELALGHKPTAADLSLVANILNISEEFVVELRDRSFPKHQQKPKQTNGTT